MFLIFVICSIIALYKCQKTEIFVGKGECSISCDGSKQLPFDNLLDVFQYLSADNQKIINSVIFIRDSEMNIKEIITKNNDRSSSYLNLFSNHKSINLEITSISNSGRTTIFFESNFLFSIKLRGGNLAISKIQFSGVLQENEYALIIFYLY